jgi:hypothetical protein
MKFYEEAYTCIHKGVFPVESLEFYGLNVISLIMALGVMAGIGGGGVVVSL